MRLLLHITRREAMSARVSAYRLGRGLARNRTLNPSHGVVAVRRASTVSGALQIPLVQMYKLNAYTPATDCRVVPWSDARGGLRFRSFIPFVNSVRLLSSFILFVYLVRLLLALPATFSVWRRARRALLNVVRWC